LEGNVFLVSREHNACAFKASVSYTDISHPFSSSVYTTAGNSTLFPASEILCTKRRHRDPEKLIINLWAMWTAVEPSTLTNIMQLNKHNSLVQSFLELYRIFAIRFENQVILYIGFEVVTSVVMKSSIL
jgi:hypothetical protein